MKTHCLKQFKNKYKEDKDLDNRGKYILSLEENKNKNSKTIFLNLHIFLNTNFPEQKYTILKVKRIF